MATTDVAMKCVSGNDIKNGSVVVHQSKVDTYASIDPKFNIAMTPEQMESKLTERFDTVEELM